MVYFHIFTVNYLYGKVTLEPIFLSRHMKVKENSMMRCCQRIFQVINIVRMQYNSYGALPFNCLSSKSDALQPWRYSKR